MGRPPSWASLVRKQNLLINPLVMSASSKINQWVSPLDKIHQHTPTIQLLGMCPSVYPLCPIWFLPKQRIYLGPLVKNHPPTSSCHSRFHSPHCSRQNPTFLSKPLPTACIPVHKLFISRIFREEHGFHWL